MDNIHPRFRFKPGLAVGRTYLCLCALTVTIFEPHTQFIYIITQLQKHTTASVFIHVATYRQAASLIEVFALLSTSFYI